MAHFEMAETDDIDILEGLQTLIGAAMYERALPEKVDILTHPQSQLFWSNLALILLFASFMFRYLYKKLPYSLIPNWIPFIGSADEFIATGFMALSFLAMGGV